MHALDWKRYLFIQACIANLVQDLSIEMYRFNSLARIFRAWPDCPEANNS
jgi:hypothetical protein